MSLLSDAMEEFTMLDKKTVDDGYGGYTQNYVEGVSFQATAVVSNTIEAKIAEKQGVKDLYTITTSRKMNLQYHDVVKRKRDDKIFRVTSDGDDVKTPPSAALDMRQVSAEEWELPKE